MATKKQDYGNDSISSLKGADRVRKRPGVIFGSDGLDGCEHAVFEILSNSIDEAREGHGRTITVTRYADRSIQVEDAGRGCPVDWNEKEQRYNWETTGSWRVWTAAASTAWRVTCSRIPMNSTPTILPRTCWTSCSETLTSVWMKKSGASWMP